MPLSHCEDELNQDFDRSVAELQFLPAHSLLDYSTKSDNLRHQKERARNEELEFIYKITTNKVKSTLESEYFPFTDLSPSDDTVLSLITLPNLLLAYAHHVILNGTASTSSPDADEDTPTPQFKVPGEFDVDPEFLQQFEQLLVREGIDLEFSEGDWSGMKEEGFDIVLTSETVYSLPSLPPLLDLLESAAKGKEEEEEDHLCLVACKRIYFGVGGGELEFRRRVEERGGKVESVWGEGTGKGKSEGVGRTVLKVDWKK